MAFLQQQQPHLAQGFAAGDRFVAVLDRADQHEFLGKKRDFGQRGFRHRQGHDRGIKPAFGEVGKQFRRHGFAHMDVEIGVGAGQVADDRRQQIGCHGGNHPDAQAARQPVLRRAREVLQLVHRAQDRAQVARQFFAKAGQPHGARAAFEQGGAQRFLHLFDLHGQGGLRDGAGFGRATEMAVAGQRFKVAELFQRQIYHKPRL